MCTVWENAFNFCFTALLYVIIINYYLAVFLLLTDALSSLVVGQDHLNMRLGAAHLVLVMNVLHCSLLHASWLHHRMVWSMWTWSQLAWWQHWAHYRICMGSTRWMPLWWSWRRLLVCSWWCPSWGLWVATLWMMVVSTSPCCICIVWSTYWSVWRAWWIRSGSLCR